MHAKYQVAIFNNAKVMANVKVGANRPTDRAKTICPPVYTGGHKKISIIIWILTK